MTTRSEMAVERIIQPFRNILKLEHQYVEAQLVYSWRAAMLFGWQVISPLKSFNKLTCS